METMDRQVHKIKREPEKGKHMEEGPDMPQTYDENKPRGGGKNHRSAGDRSKTMLHLRKPKKKSSWQDGSARKPLADLANVQERSKTPQTNSNGRSSRGGGKKQPSPGKVRNEKTRIRIPLKNKKLTTLQTSGEETKKLSRVDGTLLPVSVADGRSSRGGGKKQPSDEKVRNEKTRIRIPLKNRKGSTLGTYGEETKKLLPVDWSSLLPVSEEEKIALNSIKEHPTPHMPSTSVLQKMKR